jgi:hypothetical protein
MRPTLFHGPLPRFKRQPVHISGMIVKRKRSRTRRITRQRELQTWRSDLIAEARFESSLLRNESVFAASGLKEWLEPVDHELKAIHESFKLDDARKLLPYSSAMLSQIRAAKKERIRNKRTEREKEKCGLVTNSTLKRRRRSYPAHVMYKWTEKHKKEMLSVRQSVSEVGYHGMLKRRFGWNVESEEDGLVDDN